MTFFVVCVLIKVSFRLVLECVDFEQDCGKYITQTARMVIWEVVLENSFSLWVRMRFIY